MKNKNKYVVVAQKTFKEAIQNKNRLRESDSNSFVIEERSYCKHSSTNKMAKKIAKHF